MAIEAKVSFMNELEKSLAKNIPMETMAAVMARVADTLEGFEMMEHFRDGGEKDDLLESYISALQVEGLSQKSIDRYAYEIRRLLAHAGMTCRRITVYHIRAYLAYGQKRGLAAESLKGQRDIFSTFFNWLQRENLIDKNPMANIAPIKCPKKKKIIYSETDLVRLKDNCSKKRDRAIVSFLESTGCRISEMTQLNREDVNLEGLECVVRGKGDKERTVYMSAVAGMQLREYMRERSDDCEALFINCFGNRMQPGGVRNMLKNIAKAAGVEKVHPHKFRRTLATNLARRGMQVQEVARILGHERLDTTMEYVVLDQAEIKNSYRRYT